MTMTQAHPGQPAIETDADHTDPGANADANGPGQPPVHRDQFGNITAAVWRNTTDDGQAYYACTLTRVYRDEDSGEWRDSNGFGARDLLAVHLLSARVAQWIDAAQRRDRRQAREDSNGTRAATDAQTRSR
ncbi:MAG: hypothetical protein AAGE65_11515 [Planctomycetota bacterium]